MVVPYGDPSGGWFFRNSFDAGELGLGINASPLKPGVDCPENCTVFDAVTADAEGRPATIPRAVALYERDGGIAWKHDDQTRRARDLVLGFVSTVGNYDYGFDWIFHQNGSIEMRVALTGVMAAKAVAEGSHDPYSHPVGKNLAAPHHQHFFTFRLDLDVDGPLPNRVVEMNSVPVPTGPTNPYGGAFQMQETELRTESEAQRNLDLTTSRKWIVINPSARNALGHSTGYALLPGENAIPFAQPDSWVRKRAAFLNSHRNALDASDYGLALALAGRTSQAIAILDPAARQPGADATVRQNLALAHALAGEWDEAKIIAAQDVAPAQLDGRIQQWMKLAKPAHAADQVASLVGVTPAAVDAGQPVQLALGAAPAAQPVQVAAATPAAPQLKVFMRPNVPAPAPAKPAMVAAVAPKPAQAPVVHAAAPAPPPASVSLATLAATAVSEAKAVLASVMPSSPAPVARPAAPRRPAAVRPVGKFPAVVQLGAYGSPQRVLTAWNSSAHKFAGLKNYAPMSAKFASPKGTFYRLSVRGFKNLGEANALCSSLRRQGGSCFVRNVAGDTQLASS